jgi:hypothetical protein
MRIIYCLAILLVLSGCASQGQIAARQSAHQAALNHADKAPAEASRQKAALNQADDARCRRDRGAPGSIGYVACRMKIANNRHADEAE